MLNRVKALLLSLAAFSRSRERRQAKIDLVTQHPETGVFALILVETGPWEPGTEERELRRIQARLYDCIDAAVDGHVAAKYPASRGRPVRIQLDTYDIPESLMRPFLERFAVHVSNSSEVQQEILVKRNVKSLTFEYNARMIEGTAPHERG